MQLSVIGKFFGIQVQFVSIRRLKLWLHCREGTGKVSCTLRCVMQLKSQHYSVGLGVGLLEVKKPLHCYKGFLFGSSTWARTRDLRINSPALYRLSYRGKYSVFLESTLVCSDDAWQGCESKLQDSSKEKRGLEFKCPDSLRPSATCIINNAAD